MNKNEFVCQLFADYSIVILTKSRDWKWFRIRKKDWAIIYYDRSEFFIIG